MDNCPKCGNSNIKVSFEPVGVQRSYKRNIEGVTKFMRDDSYYYYDQVKTEHLIYICETCGYQIAKNCKDKEVGNV